MNAAGDKRTSPTNGRLWGAQARDWADVQEGQCRAVFDAVFDALSLRPGTRYCDVGCGAGLAALAFQRGAKVAGVDAAEGLLGVASARVTGGAFHLGDLEELPFPDGTFDVVTGFNSFQFAANPVAALIEAKRVSKPSGRVVVLTWGDPVGMEAAALVTAFRHLMPPPPPSAPGPFALSDQDTLRAFVDGAGLKALKVSDVACEWCYEDLRTALRGLGSSGVAARAAEQVGLGRP